MSVMRHVKASFRRLFSAPVDIENSWIKGPARAEEMVRFQSWFDKTKSLDETRGRACFDWEQRITDFSEWHQVDKRTCLEIGFGGGRLLARASLDFKQVYGVDIHSHFSRSAQYLIQERVDNYHLLTRPQLEELPDASCDFIFSFIVFQHFATFDEVDYYLAQIRRLLSSRGVCHLFFRRESFTTESVRVVAPCDFKLRHSSLFLNPSYFRSHLSHRFFIMSYEDVLQPSRSQSSARAKVEGQARVLFRNMSPKD